ncbi:MAG: MOSC domain-containing protein [Alphaproteobacteria bacterium]|nr:MOSC domain-containing protein [Alphaproteobacteria bacterium]
MSGRLIGIARRDKPRAPMETPSRVQISYDAGLEGDCRGRTPDRNVTIISREDWEAACCAHGRDLPWVTRRANLLIEGLTGFKHVGAQLKVGSVLLEVTEENPPCRVMDIQSHGLRAALQPDWRGGVACRVLQDGEIALGDAVAVVGR